MTTFKVSTADELKLTLQKVKGGDTIQLASGEYNIGLRYVNIAGGVTITSADATKPAVITGLSLRDSSGFTFSNVDFYDKAPSTSKYFLVKDSSNVHFDNTHFYSLAGTAGYGSQSLLIRESENVSVTNSEFEHMRYGIGMLRNTHVLIQNNVFHDLQTDGVRGGGNSHITIDQNLFTDFVKSPNHPDAIQFWTKDMTTSAEDINITNNVIFRGEGNITQGIFMRDEVGTLPYKDVNISGNLILGSMYNGISVSNAEGLSVTGNTVVGYPDMASWIRVNDVDTIAGNVTQTYIVNGVNTAVAGNTKVTAASDYGVDYLAAWLKAHNIANFPDITGIVGHPDVIKAITEAMPVPEVAAPPAPVITVPVVAPSPFDEARIAKHVAGTSGKDTLVASSTGDSIVDGGAGNDSIDARKVGSFYTVLKGGTGDDSYTISSDHALVKELAGEGTDSVLSYVDYTLTANVEELRLAKEGLVGHGNELDNRMSGSAGTDTLYGEAGNDTLMGLDGNDYLYGGAGDDGLSGGAGDDRLFGGSGKDSLGGGDGNDWLDGGDGDDELVGNAGADTLTGGAGADKFAYRSDAFYTTDTITDFSSIEGDRIDLSMIDANSVLKGSQKFSFIGDLAFDGTAGRLHYSHVNGGILVEGDVNGDMVADLSIFLQGVSKLSASDFLL